MQVYLLEFPIIPSFQMKYKASHLQMHHTLPRDNPNKHQYYLHKPLHSIPGKMYFQLFLLLTILSCLCSRYSLVEIKPELQKNILNLAMV